MALVAFDPSTLPDVSQLSVGILGGTGDQGRGLAYRFARAGPRVRIGSRSASRGEAAGQELSGLPGGGEGTLSGGDNRYAAAAEPVIVAVPWEGHGGLVASLA